MTFDFCPAKAKRPIQSRGPINRSSTKLEVKISILSFILFFVFLFFSRLEAIPLPPVSAQWHENGQNTFPRGGQAQHPARIKESA